MIKYVTEFDILVYHQILMIDSIRKKTEEKFNQTKMKIETNKQNEKQKKK